MSTNSSVQSDRDVSIWEFLHLNTTILCKHFQKWEELSLLHSTTLLLVNRLFKTSQIIAIETWGRHWFNFKHQDTLRILRVCYLLTKNKSKKLCNLSSRNKIQHRSKRFEINFMIYWLIVLTAKLFWRNFCTTSSRCKESNKKHLQRSFTRQHSMRKLWCAALRLFTIWNLLLFMLWSR